MTITKHIVSSKSLSQVMVDVSVIVATLMEREPPVVDKIRRGDYRFEDIEILVEREGSLSTARNAGIRRANSDNLVFLDDDSAPRREYLTNTLDALGDHAAIRGKVVAHESSYRSPEHYDLGEKPKKCTYLQGCNMAVRREVIDRVGMFEPRLPYGHEEREWSDRIRNHFDIYYIPDMAVVHPYATSLYDDLTKNYRHGVEFVTYKHEIQGESIPRTVYHAGHPPNFTETVTSFCREVAKGFGLGVGLAKLGMDGYRGPKDPLPDGFESEQPD